MEWEFPSHEDIFHSKMALDKVSKTFLVFHSLRSANDSGSTMDQIFECLLLSPDA